MATYIKVEGGRSSLLLAQNSQQASANRSAYIQKQRDAATAEQAAEAARRQDAARFPTPEREPLGSFRRRIPAKPQPGAFKSGDGFAFAYLSRDGRTIYSGDLTSSASIDVIRVTDLPPLPPITVEDVIQYGISSAQLVLPTGRDGLIYANGYSAYHFTKVQETPLTTASLASWTDTTINAFYCTRNRVTPIPAGSLSTLIHEQMIPLPEAEVQFLGEVYNTDGELIALNYRLVLTFTPSQASLIPELSSAGAAFPDLYTPGVFTAIDLHPQYIAGSLSDYPSAAWFQSALSNAPVPAYKVTSPDNTGIYYQYSGRPWQEIAEDAVGKRRKARGGGLQPFDGDALITWDWGRPTYCRQKLQLLGIQLPTPEP